MKRIFSYILLSILVGTVLPFSNLSLVSTTKAASDLIKGQSNPAVYYLYNGKRYAFPNDKIYFTWYKDFSQVSVVSDNQLAAIPLAGNVTYRPGVKMVKITTDPKVYAVASNNSLRWITTEELAKAYHGSGWQKEIHDVSDAFFVNYKIGAPITQLSNYNPVGEGALNPAYTPISTYSLFPSPLNSPAPQAPIAQTQNGCTYNNPMCPTDSECINNTCVKKKGCQYNNPACGTGQICSAANICIDDDPQPLHTTNETLAVLFSLNEAGPYYSEMSCTATTTIAWSDPQFYTDALQSSVDLSYGKLPVFVGRPDLNTTTTQAAEVGMGILTRSIPNIVRYFGAYPCKVLSVQAFSNAALGAPGSIVIGGSPGGIDHWWLLNHELTHSYFHSGIFKSWFAEGAANVLPYVNMWDQYQNGQVSYKDMFGDYPYTYTSLSHYLLENELNEDSGVRQQMLTNGVSEDTPLCTAEGNYLNGSNLGRNMLEHILINIGKKNFLSAMKTLYEKYRLTNKPLTYEDLYRTFLYFSPPSKELQMQEYLAHKLCIAL